MVRLGDPWA